MNIFDDLKYMAKPKNLRLLSEKYIQRMIENFFFSMFKYKGFPDSMPREIIERILIYNGCIAGLKLSEAEAEKYNVGMYAGRDVIAPAQPAEDPDFYGIGSKYIVTSGNGYCKTFKPSEIAIGWNNSAYSTLRLFIYNTAHDIFNALSALRCGVNYTKNHPIYKAKDDKEKAALQELWQKIQTEDDNITITSYNVLDELLQGGQANADMNVINLTDPKLADTLETLNRIVDDYIRRAMFCFGQNMQGNDKKAQESVDEANGRTSSSFILPNDMLYQRRMWLDRLKALEIVPEDAEIDFSDAWKTEELKYKAQADIDENGEIEEIEETSTEEITEEEKTEETEETKEEDKEDEE